MNISEPEITKNPQHNDYVTRKVERKTSKHENSKKQNKSEDREE